MGGIGEVSTNPSFRKRGIATTLLGKAVEYMRKNGILYSSLHSSSASPMYASLGWKVIPLKLANIYVGSPSSQPEGLPSSPHLVAKRIETRQEFDARICSQG